MSDTTKNQSRQGSVISSEMVIIGDVTFQGHLVVEGSIDGSLTGDHATLGVDGQLKGSVNVEKLECHGTLQGEITSSHLQLSNKAHVQGTITANELEMASGATLSGEIVVDRERNVREDSC
ncbi:MAG: polymer-forming cytoskeletal protein [Desulfobacterales bacterium]|nr:polymer-forming cytoskeletal protein [Deltaproteobacteria bacterium]MBT8360612.1 polymer-forming cytoskeletal protein [Deltaproteobacteria bacterium]NNK93972.1 polymer-forming cytoskeletal protein [Desulfobacterales bacterium]